VHRHHDRHAGAGAAEFFDNQGVGDRVHRQPAVGFGKGEAEEAVLAQLRQQRVGDLAALVHFARQRGDLAARESTHHVAHHELILGEFEVHRAAYFNWDAAITRRCASLVPS